MTPLAARDGALWVEGVPLAEIAARHGTPCFVYSRSALEGAYREFDGAFSGIEHLTCYALKANSNLGVLDVFARLGSGFDVVSGGELARVLAAGGDPGKVVFSGVGKNDEELRQALELGIRCFNVESESELEHLDRAAGSLGKKAPASLRINPDVDPQTHPYIATGLKESKFGIAYADALPLYRRAAGLSHIALVGIDIHIGSQITALGPYREAATKVLKLVDTLAADGIHLEHIDLGGGIGIRYRDETPLELAQYAAMIAELFRGRRESLVFEPGRRLTGNAGVLLTRVTYLKPGGELNFAVVDAAMNDLLRPALYDAWHAVHAVRPRAERARLWQIVGPVCESADFLAHDRELALREGDLLAILSAGAYAMAMSSNYNSRPRAAEVLVDGAAVHLVGRRESVAELFARESRLP
ncbi:MAG TPA: diaminopimelate decarboxylase [Casimicrobiaceae bacterium]|nr:diaminopimelate decarboxylase [Casimicrobiaceae bacterium]